LTRHKRPFYLKRAAQIIAVINAAMLLAAYALTIVLSGRPVLDTMPVISIVYTVFAVLIISRQPGHTVGWLFLIIGFFSALGTLVAGFEEMAPYISSKQIISLMIWTGELTWMPVFFIPITLVIQFFPDGKLPSRRWWPVTAATIVGILGFMGGFLLAPWTGEQLEELEITGIYNPFAIPGSEEFFTLILQIAPIFLAIGVVGSLLLVIVRFRRSSGIERFQMKWLVFTAVSAISLMLGSRFILGFISNLGLDLIIISDPNQISDSIFISFPILLAISISIAILRYQLFDIDIIIRRTLQYAIVTGILALIYFGLVVILQGLFSVVGNQESPIFIVISTLVIAGLFNPLRIRIQNIIDRRFYRQKVHAEQALAQFTAAARDEVDLDKLSEALLEVVQEAMQPESVSLTLFSDKG
jgi:hypothetical protein